MLVIAYIGGKNGNGDDNDNKYNYNNEGDNSYDQ